MLDGLDAGEITPGVVKLISRIRGQHGRGAVDLRNCGRFTLSADMSAIKDIKAVDLSEIQSLVGTLHCFEVCKKMETLDLVGCWRMREAIEEARMLFARRPWESDEGGAAGAAGPGALYGARAMGCDVVRCDGCGMEGDWVRWNGMRCDAMRWEAMG